jgi:hypothetical protein
LFDVVITINGTTSMVPAAFRWLLPPKQGQGVWEAEALMPIALGGVASGVVNGLLYVVGVSNSATLAYDISTGIWAADLAARPFPGAHHGCEVINGKLYLFGGISAGSEGKVQVCNPSNNTWTLRSTNTISSGSAGTALIGGKVRNGCFFSRAPKNSFLQ